jgi:hypothetical protein
MSNGVARKLKREESGIYRRDIGRETGDNDGIRIAVSKSEVATPKPSLQREEAVGANPDGDPIEGAGIGCKAGSIIGGAVR